MQQWKAARFVAVLVLGAVLGLIPVRQPAVASAAQVAQVQPRTRARILHRAIKSEGLETPLQTRNGLLVYAAPSLRSQRIGTLPFNATPIEVTGEGKYVEAEKVAWTRIKYGNLSGWTDRRPLFPCDVYLGNTRVFSADREGKLRGCGSISAISYSPSFQHFIVVVHAFEAESFMFLMQANGRYVGQITDAGDFLSGNNYAWAVDGRSVTYLRSTDYPVAGPVPPPPPGRGVRYDLRTGEKTTRGFRVVNVRRGDVLRIRATPSAQSRVVGTIPANGANVIFIGARGYQSGADVWWRVRYGNVTGYVNKAFLQCGVPAAEVRWHEGVC
jgi:hypothetical protein